jgi:hypothetical protein
MRKLYVIVRSDMKKSYQAVQAGHAVAGFVGRYRGNYWYNDTLIYLKASKETFRKYFREFNFTICFTPHFVFREPDMGGQATAIAVFDDKEKSLFPRLKLL